MNEQSQEQLDVKEQARHNRKSGTKLTDISVIEGTPFTYIHNNEKDTGFIALGNHIIADNFNNKEEAEAELPNVNNWELLIKIISAVTIMTYEQIIKK